MKILVTGGAGFIGFHVSKALAERGDDVVVVDNLNDYYERGLKKARIAELKRFKNIRIIKADVSDEAKMDKLFRKNSFDKICHLAAQAGVRYSIENPLAYERSNLLGTLVLLEMARHHNVKDFVFASSSSVYGNNRKVPFSEKDAVDSPVSLYAATKRSCELMAYAYHHLYGINCTGLRFFTVYGPWGRPDMAYFKFVKSIIAGEPIDVFNHGKMKRDFTFIADIVKGVVAAIDRPFPYEIINLGGDDPIELDRFISCIEKALGKKAERKLLPMQPGDVLVTMADISKAKKLLGFKPATRVEEGIRLFVEWYRSYYKV